MLKKIRIVRPILPLNLGWSNEIPFFFRIIVYLVSNESVFHGGSFDTPYDILMRFE